MEEEWREPTRGPDHAKAQQDHPSVGENLRKDAEPHERRQAKAWRGRAVRFWASSGTP